MQIYRKLVVEKLQIQHFFGSINSQNVWFKSKIDIRQFLTLARVGFLKYVFLLNETGVNFLNNPLNNIFHCFTQLPLLQSNFDSLWKKDSCTSPSNLFSEIKKNSIVLFLKDTVGFPDTDLAKNYRYILHLQKQNMASTKMLYTILTFQKVSKRVFFLFFFFFHSAFSLLFWGNKRCACNKYILTKKKIFEIETGQRKDESHTLWYFHRCSALGWIWIIFFSPNRIFILWTTNSKNMSQRHISSNINEVIKAVLNFFFFYKTISHAQKALIAAKALKALNSTKTVGQEHKTKISE